MCVGVRVWQVFEEQADGSYAIVHDTYVCGDNSACDAGSGPRHQPYSTLASARAAENIPAYSPNRVRVSYGNGKIFPSCDAHFGYMRTAANGWAAAPKLTYIQVGRWYFNGWEGSDPANFEPDMRRFLTAQADICGVGLPHMPHARTRSTDHFIPASVPHSLCPMGITFHAYPPVDEHTPIDSLAVCARQPTLDVFRRLQARTASWPLCRAPTTHSRRCRPLTSPRASRVPRAWPAARRQSKRRRTRW